MNTGKATTKELREFGLVVGIAFSVLATLMWWKHGKVDPRIFYSISAFLILAGLTVPRILRPFQWAWMRLALVLGWVMNRVLLGLIFFIIFTFVATIMRLIKRDVLHRKIDREAGSYWHLRTDGPVPAERYEHQF
jgi:hypothetical protein